MAYVSALKLIREEKGISQAQLAKRARVSLRSIQMMEQGHRDINKAQVLTVIQLAEALGCDIYDILNEREFVVHEDD